MPTALVVEDDPDVRSIARDILEEAGFDVVEAADGDQGLAKLAGPDHLDVLLTDWDMPGRVDGMGLLAEAAKLRPQMARVMVTGCAAGGCVDGVPILPKPYRFHQVVESVRTAMDSRVRAGGQASAF